MDIVNKASWGRGSDENAGVTPPDTLAQLNFLPVKADACLVPECRAVWGSTKGDQRIVSALPVEWIVAGGCSVLAVLLHLWVLHALRPRRPLGDECDYLERGGWEDPHRPRLFLRVPAIPALTHLVTRFSAAPEAALRRGGALIGAGAALLVALAGWQLGGLWLALLAALLMLLLVERVLLSAHLWPDSLLCTLHGLALYLLQFPSSTGLAILLGVVAMLATLVRIEQLALALGLLLVLVWRGPDQIVILSICLLGPSLLALAAWTLIAKRRYGIALPDTTWLFNLRILHGQLSDPEAGPTRVQRSIVSLLREQRAGDTSAPRLTELLAKLPAVLGSMLRRLLACFGPDTFVSGRLLPPMGQAYPALPASRAAPIAVMLRWSFPLLASLAIWSLLVIGRPPDYLLAAVPVLLALVVVHFRSRYRLVLMPWLCLAGADALLRIEYFSLGALHWAALGLLLLLTALHVRHPLIVEHDDQIGALRRVAGSKT